MAIFKRGRARGFGKKVRETVWPSQGWSRTFHYYRHRLFRTGDSVYKITAGLAAGAAVSWSPFIGTHIGQALFFSWVIRGNMLAGIIGTVIGNPSTFPFMFWLSYKIGAALCGFAGLGDAIALPPGMDIILFAEHPLDFLRYLFGHPLKLLLPLTLGGYLCGLVFWPLAYAVLYYPVKLAHAAYAVQRRKKLNWPRRGRLGKRPETERGRKDTK